MRIFLTIASWVAATAVLGCATTNKTAGGGAPAPIEAAMGTVVVPIQVASKAALVAAMIIPGAVLGGGIALVDAMTPGDARPGPAEAVAAIEKVINTPTPSRTWTPPEPPSDERWSEEYMSIGRPVY